MGFKGIEVFHHLILPHALKDSMVFLGLMDMNIIVCNQSNIAHLTFTFFIFSTNHKHHAFKNQNRDIMLAPHNLGMHIKIKKNN